MSGAEIVVSEFMDEAALAGFGDRGVLYDPALVDDRVRLEGELGDARALIVRNRTRVDAALLDAAPGLRVIGRLGVGLDNIDLDACAARGIAVRPATGANALSVAEYVITAALVLTRGAFAANAAMLAGEWPRDALVGGEIAGRTLGLIGFGATARAVTERARALGMGVLAHDPSLAEDDPVWQEARPIGQDALLSSADVVSLHLPLTPETRGLIGSDAIAAMKPGAVLINTARGGIVDEPALAAALREGRLGGAALDVFATEPLTAEAAEVFRDVPNLILTPHIAGVTREGNARVSRVTVANVLEELERADG